MGAQTHLNDSEGFEGLVYDDGGNALAALVVPLFVPKAYSTELISSSIGLMLCNQMERPIVKLEQHLSAAKKEITQLEL